MKIRSVIIPIAALAAIISISTTSSLKGEDRVDLSADSDSISQSKKLSDEIRRKAALHVEGNRIMNAEGAALTLTGISTGDMEEIDARGKWNALYFSRMREWGANVVRITVVPRSWSFGKREKTLELIASGVEWARRNGMYTIIDWHAVGSLKDGIYEKGFETTMNETLDFWSAVSSRLKDEPYAPFCEIFSEPAGKGDIAGSTMTWAEWRDRADRIIAEIYAHNPKAIPIVGGLGKCRDLSAAAKEPLKSKGIVFAAHPLPDAKGSSTESEWDSAFGFLAGSFPVIATEIGFETAPGKYHGDSAYGKRVTEYCAKKNIGWIARSFSPTWAPSLVGGWDFSPSVPEGLFFKSALRKSEYNEPAPAIADPKVDVLIQEFDTCAHISPNCDPESTVAISADYADKKSGFGSLKVDGKNIDFILVGSYNDSLPARDWRSARGVAFWFKGTGSKMKFKTVIIDNGGEQFCGTFTDDSTEWKRVELPFDAFVRNSWQPENVPDDGFTKSAVEGFQIVQVSGGELVWHVDGFGLIR